MRIQEMRSGNVHLKKRMPEEGQEDHFEYREAKDVVFDEEPEPIAETSCDLDEPRWSVVSFSEVEAGGLTYAQAVRLIAELEAAGEPGLCIITDDAARKAR